MNNRFNVPIWLCLVLFLSTVSAQTGKLVDEEELGVQISALAKSVRAQVRDLKAKVSSLPNDLVALELFYDDVITYVEKLHARVGPDTDLARGVSQLKADADFEHDNWLKLCNKTQKEEDCHYAKLWERESGGFARDEASFLSMVNEVKRTRELLVERRKYVIADLKLDLFDDAIVKLGQSFERIKALASDIDKLAVEVGGEKFAMVDEE